MVDFILAGLLGGHVLVLVQSVSLDEPFGIFRGLACRHLVNLHGYDQRLLWIHVYAYDLLPSRLITCHDLLYVKVLHTVQTHDTYALINETVFLFI